MLSQDLVLTPGNGPHPASMDAAKQLRQACALLSAAWESTLEVKSGPNEGARDRPHVVEIPHFTSHTQLHLDDEPNFLRPNGEAAVIPEWMPDALKRVDSKPWLARAMDIYLEGLYAMWQHPSLAMICFTATVETIGTRIFTLPRCPECGADRGYRRAFSAALRLVATEESAASLDGVYRERSKTAHAGVLHGMETTPGAVGFLYWSGFDSVAFRGRPVRMEAVARKLLKMALLDELPAKGPLPAGSAG